MSQNLSRTHFKALRYLIQVDGSEGTLLPVLPQILDAYFRIMTEIGHDGVVEALQAIIDKFGNHIEPHAVALVTQLASQFSNYCIVGDDDDDAAMAAAQCLECISTVLKGTCEKPEIYNLMYPQLIPLVLKILGNDGDFVEYLEYGLDILTFLTYFPETIAPQLWEAFPLIYTAFDQWAFDYINMMIPPLENFIGKAPQQFIMGTTANGTKFIDLVFKMVVKAVSEDQHNESEGRKALSLYMTLLHYCTGMVDNYLPAMNDILLLKLSQQNNTSSPLTRISIFQVLGSALYYNPQLELQELEKRGVTQQVFTQWLQDTAKMEKWLSRKLTLLGFTSILKLPTSSIPPSIASSLPQFITEIVKMTHKMKADLDNEGNNTDEGEDNQLSDLDDNEDEDDEGVGEDEDVPDENYMSVLHKMSSEGGDMSAFLYGDFYDDDDDFDENFSSPVDDINYLLYVNDGLKEAFQREPEVSIIEINSFSNNNKYIKYQFVVHFFPGLSTASTSPSA